MFELKHLEDSAGAARKLVFGVMNMAVEAVTKASYEGTPLFPPPRGHPYKLT